MEHNGRRLLVRFSPGLEGAQAAAERFQVGTLDSGNAFTQAFVELAAQPFFRDLPSSKAGAQAQDKSSPQRSAVKMRLSKVEPSFDGTIRDSPSPVLAAGLQGHQLGAGKDKYDSLVRTPSRNAFAA